MSRIIRKIGLVLILTAGLAIAANAQEPVEEPGYTDLDDDSSLEYGVLDLLREHGSLDQMATFLEQTGLGDYLDSSKAFTLFAPSDSAFEGFGVADSNGSVLEPDGLAALLKRHIVIGRTLVLERAVGETLVALSGDTLVVGSADGCTTIGNAAVIEEGLWCENGVIHVINAVLVPAKGHRKG